MRNYIDKITFWACLLFIALGAFAGGLITAVGIIISIWRWIT